MAEHPVGIVDVHLHAFPKEPFGDWFFTPNAPATLDSQLFEATLAQMDQLGIGQGVVSGPNSVAAEWARRAPGRFIASWVPDLRPLDPELEAERFARAVDSQGFRGLGELIMPYAALAINDQRLFPLYGVCQERQLPAFFHTGMNGPDYYRWGMPDFRVSLCNPLLLEDVAATFPDLKIVMAHLSYPFTEQAAYMLYAHSNVYVDVATVSWILGEAGFHRLLRQVVETVGADKVLFGSDQMGWPDRIPIAVKAVQRAEYLSEQDRAKILGGNARRLLGVSTGVTSG